MGPIIRILFCYFRQIYSFFLYFSVFFRKLFLMDTFASSSGGKYKDEKEKRGFIIREERKKTMSTQKNLHFETLALHVGQETADPATDARAVPIYQTTSYVFHNAQHAADRFALRDAGNIYGRLTNSTQGVLEERIAAREGGVAALAVASGAAAVTYALQNLLQAGDHIVAADNLYGGSYNLITHTLATQGITHTIVKVNDLEALEAAIQLTSIGWFLLLTIRLLPFWCVRWNMVPTLLWYRLRNLSVAMVPHWEVSLWMAVSLTGKRMPINIPLWLSLTHRITEQYLLR